MSQVMVTPDSRLHTALFSLDLFRGDWKLSLPTQVMLGD